MVCSQYAPWYVDSRSDALEHECQMMGHPMDGIRVLIKGHNNPSNMIDLRGIGESLMMVHNATFHKGYIHLTPEGGFHFIVHRNARSTKINWPVLLPNFKQNWTTLLGGDILFPAHTTISSFL